MLVLSTTAYYRVFYNPKNSKIDHYHKTPLSQLRVLEKTSKGLKVFLTHQDGYGGPKKWMGTIAVGIGLKKEKRNEFQFARQYLPVCRPVDAAIDALAAAFAKAAELLKRSSSQAHFVPPNIITTAERKQILADREEERRRELERIEREGATLELTRAIETAQASRGESSAACARAADMLVRPLRRAKRAVGMDQAIVCRAEGLKSELDEEKRTRERQERLERERLERESAVGELQTAIASAKLSREVASLNRAIRRTKNAVAVTLSRPGDVPTVEGLQAALDAANTLVSEAEGLRNEIDDERRVALAKFKAEEAARKAEEAAKKAAAESQRRANDLARRAEAAAAAASVAASAAS